MNKANLIRTLWAAPLLIALAGCTHAAKDFGGSWKPVNHFHDEPTEIPLARTYAYYASPMDGTLKTLLTRWSKDTGMVLSYQLNSDYTLYQPVSKIQTNDVRSAAAELSTIYAPEGVLVSINDKQILVSVAAASKPDASESHPIPSAAAPAATTQSATQAASATPASIAPAAPAPPAVSATPTRATPAASLTSPLAATSATSATRSGTAASPASPAGRKP